VEIITVAGGASKWSCAGVADLGAEFPTEKFAIFLNQMWVGEIFFSSDPECLKVLRY
jgi:hypothetical protein